ncbi:MAG TPA: ImmA/IrrE family metallo-endopeptidase [Candidatus Saccharimonadales bacterium]|nr:ImmA/IrrE family metallo-endopeptidase [Candidatus Saccharimonadales bacterium]
MTDDQRKILERYKWAFPVQVGKLAEELGLTVVSTTDLPQGMSGSISKEGEHYVVYVNAKQPLRRQRFTIAHEIGHFLEDRDYLDQADEILNPTKKAILNRSSRAAASDDLAERRREYVADQFAGDLLMPEAPFKEVWSKAQCLKDVADYFGVSEMAANVRAALLDLGYFDESNGVA